MKEFIVLAFLFWMPAFIVFIKNVLWDLYLWQLKEYRWDRFWVYIRWDQQEHNRAAGMIAIKFLLFTMVSLLFEFDLLAMLGITLTFAIWFDQSVNFVYQLFSKKTRRPSFKNTRNLLIIGILCIFYITIAFVFTAPFAVLDRNLDSYESFVSEVTPFKNESGYYIYPDVYIFLGLATLIGILIDLFTPFLVALGVALTYPFARFKRQLLIYKAKRYLRKTNPNLVIIGITGSEGKTTTKEILYEILSSKYKVAKTPYNFNSDVGIAKGILQSVKKDTQIFIAEMGAYRKGEIKAVTKHFPPEISIVTSLDRQHIGIFGSKQKLFEAKSEIVQGLQKDGVAILNADNELIRDMHELFSGKSIFITTSAKIFENTIKKNDPELTAMLIENVSSNKTALRFSIKTINEKVTFTIKHNTDHLVMNFALSIATAMELNISLKDIADTLKDLNIKLPRQEILKGDNETTIINDTYNSSFNGFIAGVNMMNKIRKSKAQRIIICKGIYELGRYKKATYAELIKKIGKNFDILISEDSLLAEIAKKNNTNALIFKYSKPDEALKLFWENVNFGDVVLLEGRIHPSIIQEIVKENE
ncbi:MAG: hypothetical protein KatS3mg085_234 [Candidatus Dojkabacteria bacterium]|nr:MAG: hypothetical protein KatS3mg085_234 [Candidatus Dojkabacteria bacterium]